MTKKSWRCALAVVVLALLAFAGTVSPALAAAKWWSGEIRFKLGWPPITFEKETSGADPEEIDRLVEDSLTPGAWERAAPRVRAIAVGDAREEVEAALGLEMHRVRGREGASETIRVADGYLGALSTPCRMEFGYVIDHLAVRQWTVHLDEAGRVVETEVFPAGRNEALLAEPRLPAGAFRTPPVSLYAIDYQLGSARGDSFLSRRGFERARPGLARLRPGGTRLELERVVDGRYYVFGREAWFMANGLLPRESGPEGPAGRETLVFGWEEGARAIVKARVILEEDVVREIRFEEDAP